MMPGKWALAILLTLLCWAGCGFCGKVLVWPCDMSHWLNMKCILEELIERGHEVTVLAPQRTVLIDYRKTSAMKFEVVHSTEDKNYLENSTNKFLDLVLNVLPPLPAWQSAVKLNYFFIELNGYFKLRCESVVYNQTLMRKLQETNYDILITDPVMPCGETTTLCETLGKADMWLIRTYWDFEYPQPYLPNFEFVGGLHCKPAKPLPKEMEEFVQSSGEDGVVVFSLGSTVPNLTEEKSNLIASALAQIPQKVLWRYEGKKPATLGANTQLYDWLPQNDLLGHPKTKAFITHGGINGIYEAIYHGVPMVGIPIFGDQSDNIAHMKAKGAALEVNFNTITSTDLLRALRAVINDPFYKENAMRLSRIHHDQPVKPLDRAVFWIEFVMRHKGAKHLRAAAYNLPWFQYHSLDVIGFLLACVTTAIFLVTKCCLFSCQKFGKTEKKKKRE
ncbi:UDP-glucuronosyltransferase 2A3-like isoform X2 [Eulemur rufifrons]|uniref:UDP-glucuronosyltransferase 2A3-like isoform X2 n=1 Tax=Eulemur rufifrons TaxID=859984 RepID=UPI0037428144